MYNNNTCPRCATPISMERMMGNAVVCECGWTGDKSVFQPPKRNLHIKKIMLGLAVLAIVFTGMEAKKWGKHFPERMYYKTISSFKMTNAKDEARMGYVCKQMERHQCAADAYSKALKKSPKSYVIAGALGIELSKTEQYDRAILTFQNFLSHQEGNDEHKQHYARSLSAKDYAEDATEWYYKALQTNPKNFAAAKELIQHLVKTEQLPEALSVIGHYHMAFPKTRKGWAQITDEVKAAYNSYYRQYDVKEMKISGLAKFLHTPAQLPGSNETQLFLVDPESEFLTLDLAAIQELPSDAYKNLGEKEVMATNGRSLKGTQVILSELKVGPFTLKNVKAMACDNCAFLLGKTVMKRLNFKAQNNKGVKYITLKQ